MIRRTLSLCLLLFTAGVAGGWLVPHRKPTAIAYHPVSSVFRQDGPARTGIPEPSGLPGDLIHLTYIPDIRTLRAVWNTEEEGEENALVERWAELDPVDGLQFFLFELVNGAPRSTDHAEAVATAWAERDPSAYLRFLDGLNGTIADSLATALYNLTHDQLASEPAAFLAYWSTASPQVRNASYDVVFEHLFRSDPARALAEAERAPHSWRPNIYKNCLYTSDPALVFRGLLEADGPSFSSYPIENLIGNLAAKDVAAAQEIVSKLPHGQTRNIAAQEVVLQLAGKDPDVALAWLEQHAPTAKNRQLVAEALLKTDPERALSMETEDTLWKDSAALKNYTEEIAAKDWEAALALTQPAAPGMRKKMIEGMLGALSFKGGDLFPLLDKVSTTLTGTSLAPDDRVEFQAFPGLDAQSAPAVAEWLTGQPPEVQQVLLTSLTWQLNRKDPGTAATWLASLPSSEARSTALLQTTSDWANDAPQAAAAFSLTLPPGTERDYAILNTAIAWHRNDPAAARTWADALPDSTAKTKVLLELVP